jgi:drug/metabolite transporter (DMT)-like permease
VSLPAGVLALAAVCAVHGFGDLSLPPLFSKPTAYLALSGLCQFPIATTFYYESIRRADISVVSPLTCTKSVIIMPVVLAFGLEAVRARHVVAAVLAIVGGFVLVYRKGRGERGDGASRAGVTGGVVCILLANLFWALGDAFMGRALKSVSALGATFVALLFGTAGYYAFAAVRSEIGKLRVLSPRAVTCFATHGVISFGVGYLLFFAAFPFIGVTSTVIITTAWPAIMFVVGVVVFRERITAAKLLGAALLALSACVLIDRS